LSESRVWAKSAASYASYALPSPTWSTHMKLHHLTIDKMQ
jgi:hypothetical protein